MNLFQLKNDRTKEITAQLENAIEIAMEAVGVEAEGDVKESSLMPVDTGNLKNSITHEYEKKSHTEYIGTVVKYAPFLEFGTSRMKEKHTFLKPTIVDNLEKYKGILADYIGANMK